MTIDKALLFAILSLDSYNRGYDSGLSDQEKDDPDGLGESIGLQIGPVKISYNLQEAKLSQQAQSADFYAIAYKLDTKVGDLDAGSTIISYRGTDNTAPRPQRHRRR